jgi:hypothetical protein
LPPIGRLRQVAAHVAEAVVREACASGVGRAIPDDEVPTAVRAAMWDPDDPLPCIEALGPRRGRPGTRPAGEGRRSGP